MDAARLCGGHDVAHLLRCAARTEFEKAEIIRDAAVVEQSISRRLENDQQFFDRLALDVGGERISPEEFDRVASKRAVESGYVTDIMRVTPELDVVQHAPGSPLAGDGAAWSRTVRRSGVDDRPDAQDQPQHLFAALPQ